jgi:alpha-1,3-mannosyltransferase
VYVYSGLYYLTDKGSDILRAQYLFLALQLLTLLLLLKLYQKAQVPFYVTAFLILSKRIHSIYLLRLFNDPIAMLPLYASILALMNKKWYLSSILLSLALSIKMNILLFFPGYAVLIYQSLGLLKAILFAFIILFTQVTRHVIAVKCPNNTP